MNAFLTGGSGSDVTYHHFRKESAITQASLAIFSGDINKADSYVLNSSRYFKYRHGGGRDFRLLKATIAPPANSKANAVHMDGHVHSVTDNELMAYPDTPYEPNSSTKRALLTGYDYNNRKLR